MSKSNIAVINADLKRGTYSTPNYTVTISQKIYEPLQLFYYFRYVITTKVQTTIFIKKNKKLYNLPDKINEPVKHVDLYYSIFNHNRILVLGINTPKPSNYYEFPRSKLLDRGLTTYKKIKKNDLCEKLIELNDKINNKTTYILDNKKPYNKISVEENSKRLPKFGIYYHISKTYSTVTKDPILIYDKKIFEPQLKYNALTKQTKSKNKKLKDDEFNFKRIDYLNVYFSKVGDLLILIEIFQNPKTYYFTRRHKYESSWIEIKIPSDNFYTHLVENQKRLIYSFIVLIHKKEPYKNIETKYINKLTPSDKDEIKNIDIGDCDCEELTENKFVCYEQHLDSYYELNTKKYTTMSEDQKYLRIIIYIFNIGIDIYNNRNKTNFLSFLRGERLKVFFFKNDNYPLLICYGQTYYGPSSIEDYFKKWSKIDSLTSDPDNPQKIRVELERINKMLNELNLNETKSYGINDELIDKRFDTTRIIVNCELFKKDKAYSMVTQIPRNQSIFGEALYTCKLFASNVPFYKIDPEKPEEISYNLSKLALDAISATVYYFKYDTDKNYPLLFEFKTIQDKYQYYIISNNDFKQIQCGPDKNKIDDDCLNKILDHQNFFLNNVIDISLDKQKIYTCCNESCHKDYFDLNNTLTNGYKYCNLKMSENVSPTVNNIPFIDLSDNNGLKPLNGYKVFKHSLKIFKSSEKTIDTIFTESNEFIIKGFKLNDKCVTLYNSFYMEHSPLLEIYQESYKDEIYVYFYGNDPRPLLLYYNKKAYAPMNQESYNEKWFQVQVGKNLESDGKLFLQNEQVLKQLYNVIGFLNPVRLYENITIKTGKNVKKQYIIDIFKESEIQMNLTCTKTKRNHQGCYNKLVHTHNGIKGITKNGNGFRLGNIVFNKGQDSTNHTLKYDLSKPLQSVTVYYYEHDKTHKDPLLVHLQFYEESSWNSDNQLHKISRDGSGFILENQNDINISTINGAYQSAVYLDSLRFTLKKLAKIELQINIQKVYDLKWRESNIPEETNTFTSTRHHIEVKQYLSDGSQRLQTHKYTCFQHQLSTISGHFDYNEIVGLDFTLPGEGCDIQIKLYSDLHGKTGNEIQQIIYDPCFGDIYVFLYQNGQRASDAVPLLFHFNNRWFRPLSMDDYFNKWVNISYSLVDIQIDKETKQGDYERYIDILNQINRDLNQINLEITTGNYGLPEIVKINNKKVKVSNDFKTERIEVTRYKGTNSQDELILNSVGISLNDSLYLMVQHKTINNGTIGPIKYNKKRINQGLGSPFSVSPGINFVNVYYHICDINFSFPLLLALGSLGAVTPIGVSPTEFYERLSGTGNDLKFDLLRTSLNSRMEIRNKINEINYRINHSINIKIYMKPENDKTINYPVKMSGPLYSEKTVQLFELKNHNVNVSKSTDLVDKNQKTGFKYYIHTIPAEDGKIEDKYIGRLKLFLPNEDKGRNDNEIEIISVDDRLKSEPTAIPVYYSRCSSTVIVYFYGEDPRPLMVWYDNKFFRPFSLKDYFKKWVLDERIDVCFFDICNFVLLFTLIDVSNFLNPVRIHEHSVNGYNIHKFNGHDITIQITKSASDDKFCYNRYTHKPSTGFRLGYILYNDSHIHDINGRAPEQSISATNFNSELYSSFDEVVVYYYTGDKTHKNPLLLALCIKDNVGDDCTTTTCTYKPYYELQRSTGTTNKKYKKIERPLTLEEKSDFKLETILDRILYDISKSLRIDLSFRTTKPLTIENSGQQSSTTWEGTYPATVYDNFGDNPQNPATSIQVRVSGPTTIFDSNNQQTGYMCYRHMLSNIKDGLDDFGRLRLLLYDGQYEPVTLYSRYEHTNDDHELITNIPYSQPTDHFTYTPCKGDLYVYFYGDDPRPLLLCYSGNAYKPRKPKDPIPNRQVIMEYTAWIKVFEIQECTCLYPIISDTNKHILDTLLDVVCPLNPVQLNPYQIPLSESRTITSDKQPKNQGPISSIYNIHEYKYNSQVKMKITRTNVNCYDKYTYEPAGLDGKLDGYDTRFRLGTVIYRDSITDEPKGNVNYTGQSPYKYQPLKTVDVYYYENDRRFEEPILVVLVFGSKDSKGVDLKEYWKLSKRDANTISWIKDDGAPSKIGDCLQKVADYLYDIRYLLKKLIRIELQKNIKCSYPLTGRAHNGKHGSGFSKISGDMKIEVEECNDIEFQKLKENNYTCFRHKVSLLRFYDYHKIAGVIMTFPSKNGNDQVVEIPLYERKVQSNDVIQDKKIDKLIFNSCMGDIFIYFYVKSCTKSVDNVPLMLKYNNVYYAPQNRDEYLTKWVQLPLLDKSQVICGSQALIAHDSYHILVETLNTTNKELNRIDLTYNIVSNTTCTYGIPTNNIRPNEPAIDLNRIKVSKITIKDSKPYVKLVHRPINGFRFGEIYYNEKNITSSSVIIKNNDQLNNGDTIISVNRLNNHNSFLDQNKKTNTVVVYYSDSDKAYKLPQLILLMTTEKPIEQDAQDPITAKSHTNYGYYIINHSDGICSDLKYEWRQPTNQPPKQLTLNEKSEVALLNSVLILVEKQPNLQGGRSSNSTYGDREIDKIVPALVKSGFLTKSPGLPEDINRLKHKKVTLNSETIKATNLTETGFRAISHNINDIVDPKIKGADGVTLIAILRFLIPTPDGGGQYRVLSLYNSNASKEPSIIYHKQSHNSVCVYFYQDDPRPLMIIYNNLEYIPLKFRDYFTTWVIHDIVVNHKCNKIGEPILRALVYVSNLLNPVNIMKGAGVKDDRRIYNVHKFNGQDISINVNVTKSNGKFCYNKYTHIPNKGFRLGNITYNSVSVVDKDNLEKCIDSRISQSPQFKPASEVIVYYYLGDKTHNNPLLFALCNTENIKNTSQHYYELQKEPFVIGSFETKKYKKIIHTIELIETCGSHLDLTLDKLRLKMSKTFVLILDKRQSYHGYVYEVGTNLDSCTTRKVNVQEVKNFHNLSVSGYRCYEHMLTSVATVDDIGRLKLFLSDDKAKDGENNMITFQNSSYVEEFTFDPLRYSICKGNIYVFLPDDTDTKPPNTDLPLEFKNFPLMIYFNEVWYRPKDVNLPEWTQVTEMNKIKHNIENNDFDKIQKQLEKSKNLFKTENHKNKYPEIPFISKETENLSEIGDSLQRSDENNTSSEFNEVSIETEQIKILPEGRKTSLETDEIQLLPESSKNSLENEEIKEIEMPLERNFVSQEDETTSETSETSIDGDEFTQSSDYNNLNMISDIPEFSLPLTLSRSYEPDVSHSYDTLLADDPGIELTEEEKSYIQTFMDEPIFDILSLTMGYPDYTKDENWEVSSQTLASSNGNNVDFEHTQTPQNILGSNHHAINQEGVLSSTQHSSPISTLESTPKPLPLLSNKSSTGHSVLQSHVESTSIDSYNQLLGYSIGGTIGSLIIIGSATFILVRRYRKIELTDMMPLLY